MTYTITIADASARDLVVDALRRGADARTRAAERIAGEVRIEKAAGKDVRSSAVKVTVLLGEAAELRATAEVLAHAAEVPIIGTPPTGPHVVVAATGQPIEPDEPLPGVGGPEDDGTSPEAQALAALAGLTPYDPDEPEDPITGAISEDDPTVVEDVAALETGGTP